MTIVQISIFWLNSMTWYDMVMIRVITNMDLGVAEMGFIFCGKHPLLMTRMGWVIQGPWALLYIDQIHQTVERVWFCSDLWKKDKKKSKKILEQWQAKAQTSLRIRAVWSEPLLVAWIFYDCQVIDRTSFGVFKLKRRMHRLVWVYTCQNATLLEITCRGSDFNS